MSVSTTGSLTSTGDRQGLGSSSTSQATINPGALAATQPGATPATTGSTAASGPNLEPVASAGPGGPATVGLKHSSITIGFLTTDTSNAAAAGANYGNTIGETDVDKALVNALNAKGGLSGRKIVPIFAHTDTGTTNWATDFNAACATFTQDNHVDAVLGYAFMFNEAFEHCLNAKRIPHLSTTQDGPDRTIFSQYPYFFSMMTPSIERRSNVKIDGGLAAGVVSAKSKLGIIYDSCGPTKRTYATVIKPYIKSKGLTVAADQELNCGTGAADASSAVTALQNALVRFRSNGVDTILFDTSSESGGVLFGSLFAQQQGYHPTWLLSSIASTSVQETNSTPKAQEAKMHVFGWEPLLDVGPSRYPPLSASAVRCLSLLKSQGIKPTSASDYMYVLNVCDAVFAYEEALSATGGNSSATEISRAIEATRTAHVSATTINGLSLLTQSRHDAPAGYRHAAWDEPCQCFTYIGPIRSF